MLESADDEIVIAIEFNANFQLDIVIYFSRLHDFSPSPLLLLRSCIFNFRLGRHKTNLIGKNEAVKKRSP